MPGAQKILGEKNGLHYTKRGLLILFFYLLLGDFAFQMMEMVLPSIAPLQLDARQASNTTKAFILGSTASFFNLVLNPFASFKSDNLRTKWGRRRPILLFMTPAIFAALVLMAYAPELSSVLSRAGYSPSWLQDFLPPDHGMAMMVLTIGLCVIVFQIFNFIMLPIFHYLFVDVVPDAYMGRFIMLFRIVATLAGFLFHMYVFPHAMVHTREIYLGAAVIYLVGFLIMLLSIKEGDYPPSPIKEGMGIFAQARLYVRECYSHKHYLLFNARNLFWALSAATDMFLVFYLVKFLAIDLGDIGKVGAFSQLALLVILYPIGVLADRFKAARISFIAMTASVFVAAGCFFFLKDRSTYFTLGLLYLVLKGVVGNLDLAFYASVPPQEKYGQFGSANQLIISIVMIPGSLLAGKFLDFMTNGGSQPEMYRYCLAWSCVFCLLATVFMALYCRSWKRHGGPNHYVPPANLTTFT